MRIADLNIANFINIIVQQLIDINNKKIITNFTTGPAWEKIARMPSFVSTDEIVANIIGICSNDIFYIPILSIGFIIM
uniref:Uncharacterized protein n=1 Tax=uncultured delta proteobacterium TaxID=34034 RepID=Q2YZT3_9DELT|nr:hypothetical protein [uncultured delta proteobacterium]